MKIKKFNENVDFKEDWEEEDDEELNIENSDVILELTENEWKGGGDRTYYHIVISEDHINNVRDGVYDISDLDFYIHNDGLDYRRGGKKSGNSLVIKNFVSEKERNKVIKFILDNEDMLYIGNAYETYATVFLSGEPKRIPNDNVKGNGFNYGSTNIIIDCPNRILILAEND